MKNIVTDVQFKNVMMKILMHIKINIERVKVVVVGGGVKKYNDKNLKVSFMRFKGKSVKC